VTQIATVTALPAPGVAEVTVARKTACGHDCENCAGCGAQAGSVTVLAETELPVRVGERVEIYSGQKVLAAAALVYLVPVALFLAGYLVSGGLHSLLAARVAEPLRYVCGGVGFGLGLAAAVVCDRRTRRERAITYQIIRKL